MAWNWQAHRSLGRIQAQLAAAPLPDAAPPVAPAVQDEPADFARSLPETAAVDAVVRELQRLQGAGGAAVVSVDAAQRLATPASLGRVELAVQLRGDYASIKSTLSALLDRYPQWLLMQRLSLRRGGAPTQLEASVALTLLSRPAAVPAAGR